MRGRRPFLPTRSWRQLLLVVTGVCVAVAMVTVAEMARENADRHRRAQVLVETIQASSQHLNAIRAQALADALASGATLAGSGTVTTVSLASTDTLTGSNTWI